MSDHWAIRLSVQNLQRACELRAWPGVKAAVSGDVVWLCGAGLDSALQRTLAPIADGPVFQYAEDGRLTVFGNAVPTERLPELKWQQLAEFLQPVLPAARLTSVQLPRVTLLPERSTDVQQEAVMVTDWKSFSSWATNAPEIRLHCCRFAVSKDAAVHGSLNSNRVARVVIQGNPLPPLEGERFWLAGRVAVPLGYRWTPAVDVATLEASIRKLHERSAGPQSLWIWNIKENSIDVVEASDLIPLTRANVRTTSGA